MEHLRHLSIYLPGYTLGIGIENTDFINPAATDRDVHVFADAPHLIKLIRNDFLDSGFQLTHEKRVLSGCVRQIVMRSVSDLKTAYCSTQLLIKVSRHQTQLAEHKHFLNYTGRSTT